MLQLSLLVFTAFITGCNSLLFNQGTFYDESYSGSSYCENKTIKDQFLVAWKDGSISVEKNINKDSFKRNFFEKNRDKILFAEQDKYIKVPSIESQEFKGLSKMSVSDPWHLKALKISSLWKNGGYGKGIRVAVIDTFVDTHQPQISDNIDTNILEIPDNGKDDDNNGLVDDHRGAFLIPPSTATENSTHGTHVAGIIAADPSKGPVHGLAPQSTIIPIQFISDSGEGTLGDAVMALKYAESRQVNIINASWGGAPCIRSLQEVFIQLEKKNILVVTAAGNDGRNLDTTPEFPAAFARSNQITVGALDTFGGFALWSNYGPRSVDLVAPGAQILSTIPAGGTALYDGTSMAAPMISGLASALWSLHPKASALEIKTSLLNSVDKLPLIHSAKLRSGGTANAENLEASLLQIMKKSPAN